MIGLDNLVGDGRYDGYHGDMRPFICILAGLVIASDAKLVFEIGTRALISGRAFLYGLEKTGGTLVTCDPVKMFDFSHPQLEFIQKESQEIAKDWNKEIAILFIDGDHSYSQVKLDYDNFSPFVKKGKFIVFHDTHYKKIDGPLKVTQEIREPKLTFIKSPGLAIFQKE